jgi:glyoxylase-like metal-dependent hydrolase (beta-lactamase superfamily II)
VTAGQAAFAELASVIREGTVMVKDTSKPYFPGWTRFDIGNFQITVVTDGPFQPGPPAGAFVGASESELAEILERDFLPTDLITLQQNMLIVDTGRELVLFDSGCGRTPRVGRKLFGHTTGRILDNMRAVGISPDDIDIVAMTHAHPDHVWGLTDPSGEPVYKNARLLINQVEFEHWTSLANADRPEFVGDRMTVEGARANLLPYRDRISFVADGEEPIKGIKAITAVGHSPGHTMYQIESRAQKLLQWGDLAHHPVLLARPELSIIFDFDRTEAVQSRLKVLDWVAKERVEVFGCHFGFPGRGYLRKSLTGYDWVPVAINTLQP